MTELDGHAFGGTSRASPADPNEHDGWVYLLPAGKHAHLVCLDDEGHSMRALAPWCARLTVVCADRRRAESLEARKSACRAGSGDVFFTCLDDLAAGAEPVDGVVANFLASTARLTLGQGRQVIERLAPALPEGGFVCALVANRYSYTRLRTSGAAVAPDSGVAGARGLRRWVRGAGFSVPGRIYPLVVDQGQVLEVVLGRGYRSHFDYPHGGERLREIALGPRLGPWVAPALAIVSCRGRDRVPQVEALAAQVSEQLDLPSAGGGVRRFLVLRRKIIVSIAAGHGATGWVVVVPRDGMEWRRRRHESEMLASLSNIEPIARRVPRTAGIGTFAGYPFSILEEVRGVCVDGPVRDLQAVTEHAAGFACDLATNTLEHTRLDNGHFKSLLGDLTERAAQRHPGARPVLERIEASLWKRLQYCVVPTVLEHGDFKIENVVIDRRHRHLRGVIDWELGRPRGLPLMDLLYLLVYNRMLTGQTRFLTLCREVVMAGTWAAHERLLLRCYVQAVPIPTGLMTAIPVIFPVHALARRFQYEMDEPNQRRRVLDLLGFCADAIEPGRTMKPRIHGNA